MGSKLGLYLLTGLLLLAACGNNNQSPATELSAAPSPTLLAATAVPTSIPSTVTPAPTETPAPTSTSLPTIVPPPSKSFVQCHDGMKARVHMPTGTSVDQLEDIIAQPCYEKETDWQTGVWGHIVSQTDAIPTDSAGNPIPYAFEPNPDCDASEPYLCEGFELWVPNQVYGVALQPEPPFLVPEFVEDRPFQAACIYKITRRNSQEEDYNPEYDQTPSATQLTINNELPLGALMPWVHSCYQELMIFPGSSNPDLSLYGSQQFSVESVVFSHLYNQVSETGEHGASYADDDIIIRPGTYELYLKEDASNFSLSQLVALGPYFRSEDQTQGEQAVVSQADSTLFSTQIVGYGEHGAMVEVSYLGDEDELEGITMFAALAQDGERKEIQPVQKFEGRYLAEMTEAVYQFGEIAVELILINQKQSPAHYSNLLANVMFEHWYPFVGPMLAASEFVTFEPAIKINHLTELGRQNEYYAIDICSKFCSGDGDYEAHGKQVYMPFSLKVQHISTEKAIGQDIVIYHPFTGFVFLLGHQVPSEQLLELLGDPSLPYYADLKNAKLISYDPTMPISHWNKNQSGMIPHLHLEGQLLRLDRDDGWAGVFMGGTIEEGNCLPQQDYGPCPPKVHNISVERYLLDDWVNPDL